MLLTRIAASVVRMSACEKRAAKGGRVARTLPTTASARCRWAASHWGDSGSAASTISPSTAGRPARLKIQRHESGVIGQMRASWASRKMPALSPAAITPETVALEAVGQLSPTNAMPLGHIPPTPSPTRNRSSSICSWVCTRLPAAAQTE